MNLIRLSSSIAAAAVALSLLPATPGAQPVHSSASRPVRLVVPFAPGGPADSVARAIAPALEKSLGQALVVENRVGADGIVGARAVLGAAPDGHTLLFASASLVPLALSTRSAAPDLRSDFAAVSRVALASWAMYVSPEVPARTVGEFIAHARANPGKLNYAASTLNDSMAAAQFMKATGIEMVKVPYKGAGQAMPDLVAGRVQVNFSPLSALGLQHAHAGRVRMLAVLSPQRSALAPEVPTLAEAGVGGVTVSGWLAILAPARTPGDVVARLQAAIASVVEAPDVRALLGRQAMQAESSSPQSLAASIEEDFRTWSGFVREHGLLTE